MSTVKTNTIQPVTTGDNLIIRTGAGDPERIRITASGNVGIGGNPLTLLHVAGPEETHTNADAAQLLVSNVANTRQIQIAIGGGSTGGYIEGWIPGTGGMPLYFQPSGSASVFSGPLYARTELHLPRVAADEDGAACVFFGNETTSSGVPTSDGAIMKYADNFGEQVDSVDGLMIEKTDINQPSPDGGIAFTRRGSTGVRTYDLMIRDGRVGIGVTAPSQALDVNGGVKVSGVARFGAGTFPQIKKVEFIPTFTTNSVKDTDNFYFIVYGTGTTATLSTILSDFTTTAVTSTTAIAAAQNGGVAGTVGALKYSTKINPLTISITPRLNTSKLLVKFKVSCSEPVTVDSTGSTSEGDCGFIITRSINGGAETLVGIPAAAITSAGTRGLFHSVIAITVKENSAADDLCLTEIEYLDEDGAAQSWGGKTVTYFLRIYGKEGPGVPTNTQRIFLGRGKSDLDQGDDSRALSYSIIQEYFE